MIKIKNSQDGFGYVEVLLTILAVIIIIGVGLYVINRNSDNTNTTNSVSKTTPVTKTSSNTDLIVAAVKSYTGASTTGSSQQNASVDTSNITIVGDNAKGTVSFPPDGGGAIFITHKDSSGAWSVIFEGQQSPSPSLGAKYGLPAEWYSAN